jgi:hypothetical protein
MVSSYIWWLEKAEKWKIFQSSIDEIRKMGSFNNFMYSKYDREMINEVDTDLIDYITDSKGKVILKFIGRFENLEDDWRRICNNTGIGCRKLPNENRGGRDDYRKYYNDETRAIVAARFKKFIEMFGYEF